ncbi:hypothetical protein ACLOJK_021797 [Asimina triloba]
MALVRPYGKSNLPPCKAKTCLPPLANDFNHKKCIYDISLTSPLSKIKRIAVLAFCHHLKPTRIRLSLLTARTCLPEVIDGEIKVPHNFMPPPLPLLLAIQRVSFLRILK